MKKRAAVVAFLALAIGAQAQVTLKPDNSSTDGVDSYTYTIADVSATPVVVTGDSIWDGLTDSDLIFSGGAGAVSVTYTGLYGYTNSSAVAATNDFAAYVATLQSVKASVGSDDWAVDSSSVATDPHADRINPNEVAVFTFNTSGLTTGDLFLNSISLTIEGDDVFDFIIYNPASNLVENAEWSLAPTTSNNKFSFTNQLHNGSQLLVALQSTPARHIRIDAITLDISAPPPAVNEPPFITDVTSSNVLVEIDWLDDKNLDLLDYYDVYRSLSSNGTFEVVASPTDSFFSDGDVTNKTTYYYKAKAVDTNGVETTFGNMVSATPAVPVPTGLLASAGDGEVVLDWDDSIDYLFDSFSLYRSTTTGTNYTILASNLLSSAYTDSNVVNEVTYYYVVAQADGNGDLSDFSSQGLAKPTTALVLEFLESDVQAEVRAFNNGAGGYLPNGAIVNTGSNFKAGEYGASGGQLARSIIKFPFSAADLGGKTSDDITRVLLRLYFTQNLLNNDGSENAVELYASQTENATAAVVAGDFENANYTLLRELTEITTNAPTDLYYEFDVTATVLADLANDTVGEEGSCFRLQLKNDLSLMTTTNDLVTAVFKGNDSDDVFIPQLKIEWNAAYSYAQWAEKWPAADLSDPSADNDEDGLDNLHEYGVNGDPTDGLDQGVLSSFGPASGGGYEYMHAMRGDDPTLVYRVETTDSLTVGSWTNLGYVVTGTNITGDTLNVVTNTIDTIDNEKFIRLIIEN